VATKRVAEDRGPDCATVLKPIKPLLDELTAELQERTTPADASVPTAYNGYVYQRRFVRGSQYPVIVRWKDIPEGSEEEVVLDVGALSAGHQRQYHLGSWTNYFRLWPPGKNPRAQLAPLPPEMRQAQHVPLSVSFGHLHKPGGPEHARWVFDYRKTAQHDVESGLTLSSRFLRAREGAAACPIARASGGFIARNRMIFSGPKSFPGPKEG
jgi:hypothetical protein